MLGGSTSYGLSTELLLYQKYCTMFTCAKPCTLHRLVAEQNPGLHWCSYKKTLMDFLAIFALTGQNEIPYHLSGNFVLKCQFMRNQGSLEYFPEIKLTQKVKVHYVTQK